MWAAAPESGKYGVCICSLKPESSELGLREVQLRIKWPPADILCAAMIEQVINIRSRASISSFNC